MFPDVLTRNERENKKFGHNVKLRL